MSNQALVPVMPLTAAVERYNDFAAFVKTVLKEGLDFGTIPGTNKPTLFKPGAEKICTLFALVPVFTEVETVEDWTGKDHGGEPFFYYKIRCQLSRSGQVLADCIASCNSWESRYRYRSNSRTCPECGKATIIKGKVQYGGGWICFAKKGGCGFKFKDDDPRITGQVEGKAKNEDIFDQVNTLVKQAQKRAMVGATLIGANASEFFTQDMEDLVIDGNWQEVEGDKPKESAAAKPATAERERAPKKAEVSPDDDQFFPPPEDEISETKAEEYESMGIKYSRRANGEVFVKFGEDWRPAAEQVHLSATALTSVDKLFQNNFEREGHLYKHFRVKSVAALNWEQLLALLNFKKKNIVHAGFYADKLAVDEPKPEPAAQPQKALVDFFGLKDAPAEQADAFLAEVAKLADPKQAQVLLDAGLNTREHLEQLTNILNLVNSGTYPLLDDAGHLNGNILEMVDYARSSAH